MPFVSRVTKSKDPYPSDSDGNQSHSKPRWWSLSSQNPSNATDYKSNPYLRSVERAEHFKKFERSMSDANGKVLVLRSKFYEDGLQLLKDPSINLSGIQTNLDALCKTLGDWKVEAAVEQFGTLWEHLDLAYNESKKSKNSFFENTVINWAGSARDLKTILHKAKKEHEAMSRAS
nr:hypothetical protein L204_02909 [Cryptococcus depauperatus CBS 7855]